jgi:hypothetical protein
MGHVLTEAQVQSLRADIDRAIEGWHSQDERVQFVSHIEFWCYCAILVRAIGHELLPISADSVQPSCSRE